VDRFGLQQAWSNILLLAALAIAGWQPVQVKEPLSDTAWRPRH
jgi:hypothetical protein